jgi:hypothetical protein
MRMKIAGATLNRVFEMDSKYLRGGDLGEGTSCEFGEPCATGIRRGGWGFIIS